MAERTERLSPDAGPTPKYAVIVRTHFWDAFMQRQMQRLLSQVTSGDVFLLVDETSRPVPGIEHDRVVRVSADDVNDLGLPQRGEQNLLWFNGDYPLYVFLQRQPDYDYYLQIEYDVVLNTDVDALLARVAADRADFVGLTKGEPVAVWMWRHTCLAAYDPDRIDYKLICACIFSRAALAYLLARRQALATALRSDQPWPFCEGFIATEIALAGMRAPELSDYLDTSGYDSWPPYIEADLPELSDKPVIHPMLDQPRYVASLQKYGIAVSGYLNPMSMFHRKLRRLSPRDYVDALVSSFAVKMRRRLADAAAKSPIK